MNLQQKKGLLDNLYYNVGKQQTDYFVCGTYIDKKGIKQFTKWRKYLDAVSCVDVLNGQNDWKTLKYFESINQRQILPNEIVLDLEDPKQLKPVVDKLKKWGWEYSIFSTGSRGHHVHIFFNEDFTTDEKEAIVRKFGADVQKCSEKNLIALEGENHWKTGRPKQEVTI